MAGRVIFITGASSGIGAATARAAVAKGWRVAMMARNSSVLKQLATELGGPEHALALPGDATELGEQDLAMRRTAETFGRIDAVFANAGRGANVAGTETGDPEEWREMVDINILGVLWTAKTALPYLRASKGHFVVTGSAAGRRHIKGSVYGATKWFVQGFAGNLADEMAEWGGHCTVITPGMVDTPFFDTPKPGKIEAEDVAAAVMHAVTQPTRTTIREIHLMPTN